MLTIGRIFAGDGWRYLRDQVARGGEDYYLLDVGRGEAPGRWGGIAAEPELGLAGEVNEEQMRRVFGRLAHPAHNTPLGRPPRAFRSVDERLRLARALHEAAETTVLVVDHDRTVRFVDVQPDYTARTEVADIIAALTDLT
jgi:hypothetical protein